jgi:hypothetical protein
LFYFQVEEFRGRNYLMIDDSENLHDQISLRQLKYCGVLCTLSLNRLGHIDIRRCTQTDIVFGSVREEKGLLGGTSQTEDGRQLIVIDPKVSKEDLWGTVAHEAVHAIQFMKGDAKRVGPGLIKWKGKQYQILPAGHPDYANQPWEEEAYRLAPQVIAKIQTFPQEHLNDLWSSLGENE